MISTRRLPGVALSWIAMIGVDLSLHAGVLAPLYDWSSPFSSSRATHSRASRSGI